MKKETNAIIQSATLEIERGFLSSFVMLDYGGAGQGFGGFVLYGDRGDGQNYAGHWIYRVLQIAGVERWSDLKGKAVRCRADFDGVEAIGHIVKDDWFNPKEEFERMMRPWEAKK